MRIPDHSAAVSKLARSLACGALASAALVGCSSTDKAAPARLTPLGQASFDAYRQETKHWLQQQRRFQTVDPTQELDWNAPQEWRPAPGRSADRPQGRPKRGILLVHGLGDSPWSFTDIGRSPSAASSSAPCCCRATARGRRT